MSALSPILRGLEGGLVAFWCPGCNDEHVVGVEGPNAWGYNGNPDAPTLTPSVLVRGNQIERDASGKWTGEWISDESGRPVPFVCHSFVTDGRIQFLDDCTHALAGVTASLPEWPK